MRATASVMGLALLLALASPARADDPPACQGHYASWYAEKAEERGWLMVQLTEDQRVTVTAAFNERFGRNDVFARVLTIRRDDGGIMVLLVSSDNCVRDGMVADSDHFAEMLLTGHLPADATVNGQK